MASRVTRWRKCAVHCECGSGTSGSYRLPQATTGLLAEPRRPSTDLRSLRNRSNRSAVVNSFIGLLLGAYYETLGCIPRMPQDMALPFRGASILAENNAVAENGAQGQPLQPPSPGI